MVSYNWEEDWNCINYIAGCHILMNVVSDFRYHHSLGIDPIHGVNVGVITGVPVTH